MKRKLDKKRPYAEIFGSHDGKYEQFGILFDCEGIELEGYKDVVIPDDIPVITADSNDSALRAEISRLSTKLGLVTLELEEKDAEIEEIQGKLDTANVELNRFNTQAEASFPGKPAKDVKVLTGDQLKAQGTAAAAVDAQLKAQGV